jgi:4-amino-4-deoxy-L-arabinose transferase-like glycosyltransferase
VAPLGFLLSVKVLSFCFGYSEYSLRIIPLLAGILIFPIAYSFAVREFDKKFACVFLFFLATSTPLLFYSIQFKHYATETLVSLVYLDSFFFF